VWLEAVRTAEARFYRVLSSRPAENEAKLSFAALSDLVGGAFDDARAALPAPQERALAERHIEESCSMLVQSEAQGPEAMRFAWRSLVDAHRGQSERARSTLLSLIEKFERAEQDWWTAMALSALGFVEFTREDHKAADAALTQMRRLIEATGIKEAPLDRSEPFHIESLIALGDLDGARDALARLQWRGSTLPRLWITTTLPRARALVLAAEGDVEAALAAFDELDLGAASRLPFELGWAELVKGKLHRRSKQKRAATDALRHALEIFERLGAPVWAEWTRSELARVRMRQRSRHELTATELLSRSGSGRSPVPW
jgi:tetratricopeptide (TPR) repeat protein